MPKTTMEEILTKFDKKYSTALQQCDCQPDKVLMGILIGDFRGFLKESLALATTEARRETKEKVENWFNHELESNTGDIKTYRNIAQDKEGVLAILTEPNQN
jgi:hypothetical protein